MGARPFDVGDGLHPVDLTHQDRLGHLPRQCDVESDPLRPPGDDRDAVGQAWSVESDLDLHRVEHRREDGAAAQFLLTLGSLTVGDLRAVQLEPGQLFGCSGDHHRASAVADGQRRRLHGSHVVGELLEQRGDPLRFDVGHRHHRRTVAGCGDAAAARDQRSGRTDQRGQREQFDVAGTVAVERLDREHTLGVTGQRHRGGFAEVETLAAERADGGDLAEQHAGNRDRRGGELSRGGHGLAGGQRAHPLQRREADRPHHHQLIGHRLEEKLRLGGDPRQFGLDPGESDEFLQRGKPGTVALPAEGDGVRLTTVEAVHEGVDRGGRAAMVSAGPQAVVLVDRHRRSSPHRGELRALRVP